MKRVLVLGAGMVSGPLVRYLLEQGYWVTVATENATLDNAKRLVARSGNGEALEINIQARSDLNEQIQGADLVVSLLPYSLHPMVAKGCIAHKKPMVTTSHIASEMQALDAEARDAGVTLLNEIGLDPGIDHMSAMRLFEQVRARGGKVVSFESYCGGLPAPEANDNPFGFKFSWAPREVLLAGRLNARYRLVGRTVEVEAERLFRDMHVLEIEGAGDFEAYPNRDATQYVEIYGLEGIQTIYRGTLRNMGWCDCMYQYGRLGLLDPEALEVEGGTYAALMRRLLDTGATDDLRILTAKKLGLSCESLPVLNLQWLGMFAERPLTSATIGPLDALGTLMYEKLAYRAGERDMIVLFHRVLAELADQTQAHITSKMVAFGIADGESAMAHTVSLPAAIAADLLLRGKYHEPGVRRPTNPELYNPILNSLAQRGITCEEQTEAF